MDTTNNWTINEQHEFDTRMALRWCGEGPINVEEEEEDRINDEQMISQYAFDAWWRKQYGTDEIPF